ncbi:MAG: hypothetical protein FWC98_01570, partial [Bacteroidales bacterium]|nr:hypothetical protein [Bacteroidales bacterium]
MKPTLTKISIAIISAIIICGLTLFTSCREVQIFPGRIEIVERSFDPLLQDSAMVQGYVLDALMEYPFWNPQVVFIAETGATALSDSTGFYFMKLLPGTYTVEVFCSFAP